MDKIEKMILFIFKNSNGNSISLSERGYNGIDIDGMNFKDYSYSEGKEIKNKKIYQIMYLKFIIIEDMIYYKNNKKYLFNGKSFNKR